MEPVNFTPTGEKLTAEEMKFGYWFVTHRLLLRRIGLMAFMAVDAIIVLAAFYGLVSFYFIARGDNLKMQQALTTPQINFNYWQEKSQPMPLAINFSTALNNGGTKYDMVASVMNPNKTWYSAAVKYHFQENNVVTPTRTDYILPLQEKYVMELGYASDTVMGSPELVIEDVAWQKVTDYELLRDKIFNIEIANNEFSSQIDAAGARLNQIHFEATNNSAYNFWDMHFKVLLYRGDTLVYVNDVPIRTFMSNEKKDMWLSVFPDSVIGGKVLVVPEVDILNPASFKAF